MAGQKFEEGETVMTRLWDKTWVEGTVLKIGVGAYSGETSTGRYILVERSDGWADGRKGKSRIWPSRQNILKLAEYNATIRPRQEARQRMREEAKQERMARFRWYATQLLQASEGDNIGAMAAQAASWFQETMEAQRDYEFEHPRTAH